jgi:O-antigen ligase
LASRAVLISGVVVVLCFLFLLSKKTARTEIFLIITGVLVLTGVLIVNISSFKMRYVAQLKEDLTQQSINNEILEPRVMRWEYILKEIKKSPVTGYGTGSEQAVLNQTYFDNKLYNSYLHQLNSHNQYLGIWLEQGIWGLLIFIITLVAGLILAVRTKNAPFLSVLIIICIVSFSENILAANKGIFFYAFFFSLFVLSGKPFDDVFRFRRGRDSRLRK